MLLRPTGLRPGISLLEVLTAIFIMGVGMLALLTLFPIGALSMARAIRDDRAAHIAANATAIATSMDLANDIPVLKLWDRYQTSHYVPNNEQLPSNPVLVDPHYLVLSGVQPLGQFPPGSGLTSFGIQRVTPTWVTNTQNRNRWFTFQDEIQFDTFGGAKGWQNGSVNRPGTYTTAYLLRRAQQSDPKFVEMSIIVYSQRNLDIFEPEPTYNSPSSDMGAKLDTALSFDWSTTPGASKPEIRRGTWIVDVTCDLTGKSINGHLYRVEDVYEDKTNPTLMRLELDRPLKAAVKTFVVLKDAIAVVERGTAWRP